jgi:hypothetical protein
MQGDSTAAGWPTTVATNTLWCCVEAKRCIHFNCALPLVYFVLAKLLFVKLTEGARLVASDHRQAQYESIV